MGVKEKGVKRMKWADIEKHGRVIYNLSEEWHLCAADASDENVMKIEFGKKGPRGGWLKGSENRFDGYLVNYKELGEAELKPKDPEPEQLNLFS